MILSEWCQKNNRIDLLEDYRRGNNRISPEKLEVHWIDKTEYDWQCDKGHPHFSATFGNRAKKKGGKCPYCAGDRPVPGVNDLYTVDSRLMNQWDWEKNNAIGLNPHNLLPQSNRKAHWKCRFGHTSFVKICSKHVHPGCKECAKAIESSFPENAIYYYLSKAIPHMKKNIKPVWLNGKELDIYIPDLHVAIEYDGQRWHKNIDEDCTKNELCQNHGITLIRIREPKCPNLPVDNTCIILKGLDKSALDEAIKELLSILNINYGDINTAKDEIDILDSMIIYIKENSLAVRYPDIANLWNYEKNGTITPNMILPNSNHKFNWKCHICHQAWTGSPNSMITKKYICSYCAGLKPIKGKTDFATVCPDKAKYWDYEKNTKNPDEILPSSNKKFHFKCPICGNKWSAAPNWKSGCAVCSGHKVMKGFNDFATKHTDLLKDWDYENNTVKPDEITSGADIIINWKCHVCGFPWPTYLYNRTGRHNKGCPACNHKAVYKGYNDFETVYPEHAKEWNYEKNKSLPQKLPNEYLPHSNVEVWWLCPKGHEFKASIAAKVGSQKSGKKGKMCPYCKDNK